MPKETTHFYIWLFYLFSK